jgi:glycerophosphoryl diester phosphodiesterase
VATVPLAEQPRPLLIAHRGLHAAGAKENTIAAFEAALDVGVGMVELDVRRTADGALVIFHDPVCRREALDTISHAELCKLAGLEVPLLGEVLDWAAGRIALDIELKEDGYVDEITELLNGYVAEGGELIVTSFTDPILAQLPPEIRSGLILSMTAIGAGTRAKSCNANALVIQMKLVNEAVLADAQANELDIYLWDFLAAKDGVYLSDPRIDGVITDDVQGVLATRSSS